MTDSIRLTIENLKKNRFAVDFIERKEDVLPLIRALIPTGSTVATGGSQSLSQTGVIDLLKSGEYVYYDRIAPHLSPEQRQEMAIKGNTADYYLCSSNAVTESGELYNVDGNCNRISAIAFGPKQVIMVVGVNKIVPNMDSAIHRVKTIAAPLNTKRLNCDTYCFNTGVCMGVEGKMTDGCRSSARICCNYLISGQQRAQDRIRIILVNEELGF